MKSPYKYQGKDKSDLDAGRPLRYHTPKIKKEIAKKMKGKYSLDHLFGGSPVKKLEKIIPKSRSGNYKKHLDKVYKEEDDFSTRKGE